MKHTEGKWEVNKVAEFISSLSTLISYSVNSDNGTLVTKGLTKANANLIASAPEILKALKQNVACATNIQNAIEGRYKDPYDFVEYTEANEIVNRSQRIIRKAEKGTK